MVKLKLSLSSNKPCTVYSLNGKSYVLNPGSNTIDLEYSDYVSLAKALGIKPVLKDDDTHKEDTLEKNSTACEDSHKEDTLENSDEICTDSHKEDALEECDSSCESNFKDNTLLESTTEETCSSNLEESSQDSNEDIVEECTDSTLVETKKDDFESMTTSQLKEEYKRVTGNTCKIKKKQDIIAFLREH